MSKFGNRRKLNGTVWRPDPEHDLNSGAWHKPGLGDKQKWREALEQHGPVRILVKDGKPVEETK